MNLLRFFLMLLLCANLAGCSEMTDAEREKIRTEIQAHLDAQYPDLELAVLGVELSPRDDAGAVAMWDRYAFTIRDKSGLVIRHHWFEGSKSLAPGLRKRHYQAVRKREIREFITAALPPELKTDVYVGINERDIQIFCMNILTAENKEAVIKALRATLDQADAALTMGGYAVQALFTWQGRGPHGRPPFGYDGYLGVVLFPGQGMPCFQLAGKYIDEVIAPTVKARAKEITDSEGWSRDPTATKFLQINQEDFSEIFAGVGLEREHERDSTYLFMVFDTASLEVKEHSFVRLPHAESDTRQSRYAAWKEMIPSRFRCPDQSKRPKVQVQYGSWWDVR